MTPDPPFAVDPLNPTNAELAAAIQRGLADGTLIDSDDWLASEAARWAEPAVTEIGENAAEAERAGLHPEAELDRELELEPEL